MKIVLGLHDLQLGRAIRAAIDDQGRLQVVGAASTAEGLVEMTDLVRPDVVLVDEVLATAADAGIDALRAASDDAAIIVLLEGGRQGAPVPTGATAYLEHRPVAELVNGLTDVATIAVKLRVASGLGGRRTA
jgi:chemotaxis response regulator CheB